MNLHQIVREGAKHLRPWMALGAAMGVLGAGCGASSDEQAPTGGSEQACLPENSNLLTGPICEVTSSDGAPTNFTICDMPRFNSDPILYAEPTRPVPVDSPIAKGIDYLGERLDWRRQGVRATCFQTNLAPDVPGLLVSAQYCLKGGNGEAPMAVDWLFMYPIGPTLDPNPALALSQDEGPYINVPYAFLPQDPKTQLVLNQAWRLAEGCFQHFQSVPQSSITPQP